METPEESVNIVETSLDFVSGDIHDVARAAFIIMGVIMVFGGVIGNCLFLLVIFKQSRRKQSVHILFVANLSLADLVSMGYWFTFFVLDLILNRHPVVNYAHCVANGIIVSTMYLACVSFLVSISLNRYLHVCRSHLYKRVFTKPRTVAWCLLVWLSSLCIALLPVMDTADNTNFHYNPVTRFCSYNRQGFTYFKVIALVYAILPMVFVAYCNFAIFRYWKRARLSIRRHYPLLNGTRVEGKRRNVIARLRAAVKKGNTEDVVSKTSAQGSEYSPTESVQGMKNETDSAVVEITAHGSDDRFESAQVLEAGVQECVDAMNNRDSDREDKKIAESEKKTRAEDMNGVHISVIGDRVPDDAEVTDDEVDDDRSLSNVSMNTDSEDRIDKRGDDLKIEDTETGAGPGTQLGALTNPDQPSKRPGDAADESTTAKLRTTSSFTQRSRMLDFAQSPPVPRNRLSPAKQADKIPKTAKQTAKKRAKRTKAREVAFIRSLFVVFLLAVVTFITYGAMTVLGTYVSLSPEVVILGNFFLFFNNSVNWIVYGVMNPVFRQGYVHYSRKILTSCCSWRKAGGEGTHLNVSLSSLVTPSAPRSNATTSDLNPSSTSLISPVLSRNDVEDDDASSISRC
ncbi:hypothetical protein V1264_021636 [Littorina saxatilis]|uniref:G-protein coupled receptors family 1 profile domain-containing protein n=2 Tax=Littorina saxatilis TaxID=31220 RepID=A0AAN9AIL4_9CAEN